MATQSMVGQGAAGAIVSAPPARTGVDVLTAWTNAELRDRLRTEAALAAITRDFLDRGQHDLDACITDALGAICRLAGCDRGFVFLVRPTGFAFDNTHEWCVDPRYTRIDALKNVPLDSVPLTIDALLDGRPAVLDLASQPAFAREVDALHAHGTETSLLVPMIDDGHVIGCIGLDVVERPGIWRPAIVSLVERFALLLVTALERGRVERTLRDVQVRFEEAWKHAPIGMIMASPEGTLLRVNPAYCEMLGYGERELIGVELSKLVHPGDEARYSAAVQALLCGDEDRAQVELRMCKRVARLEAGDDEWRWCRVSASLVRGEPGVGCYLIGQVEDITEQRRFEERLAYEATHDALTGLPQRKPFLEGLERALAAAERRGDLVAVLFIDLDDFKRVNDTLGHAAGDELLQQFAVRLTRALRTMDLTARLGGDEFVVMCTDFTDASQVVPVAQRILSLVERSFQVRGVDVFVGASIGIAVAEPGVDAATLLRQADSAAYRAKERGRNRYELFDDELRAAVSRRLELESSLRRALERDEIGLQFQPIVDTASDRIVAFEALACWQRADGALVAPGEFLPIAEETGMVVPIGARLVHAAVEQLARWHGEFGARTPVVALNVSMRQLLHAAFVDETRAALDAARGCESLFGFEISECALRLDAETSVARLAELRALGVRLAIAEFGTGSSPLDALRRLPIDAIKLDRSLAAGLGRGDDTAPIVAALVALGRGLHLGVVADGVDDADRAASLRALGCEWMQGAFFSAPLSAGAATELLRQPASRAAR